MLVGHKLREEGKKEHYHTKGERKQNKPLCYVFLELLLFSSSSSCIAHNERSAFYGAAQAVIQYPCPPKVSFINFEPHHSNVWRWKHSLSKVSVLYKGNFPKHNQLLQIGACHERTEGIFFYVPKPNEIKSQATSSTTRNPTLG